MTLDWLSQFPECSVQVELIGVNSCHSLGEALTAEVSLAVTLMTNGIFSWTSGSLMFLLATPSTSVLLYVLWYHWRLPSLIVIWWLVSSFEVSLMRCYL